MDLNQSSSTDALQSLALLPLDCFSSDSDSCSEDEDDSCSSDNSLHSEPPPLSSDRAKTSSAYFHAKANNDSRQKVLIEELPDKRRRQD